MKKTILLVLAALVLLSGTALGAVYVYKAKFSCQVTVEPGMPGLSITPTQLDFGVMAVGDWSRQEMLTVKNIGSETIVSILFEKTGPEGLGFYTILPPIVPLLPGTEITFPVLLKASETMPLGSYAFNVTVVGQR